MAVTLQETDQISEFDYDSDDETAPDPFSLTKLTEIVSKTAEKDCMLVKLAEGGYHKIYDVLSDSQPVGIVARVAAPAFPKDKLESEIATMQYLASHTNIHTPRVHGWESNANNPVGLEYMILEKISGVSASDVWDTLSLESKKVTVSEVADHMIQLFRLRFDTGGSLYNDTDGNQVVGPVISIPFYRALDGYIRFDQPLGNTLASYRGPFRTATAYLRSSLDAELRLVEDRRKHILEHELEGDDKRLEQGRSALAKAVDLCAVYPGDVCVSEPLASPNEPFSLRMDDFRLSNIMINKETGHVTGIIDFEGATVAPLWECAYIPRWLQDHNEWDGSYEGGSAEDKKILRELFLEKVQELDSTGEWIRASERGRPFREFTHLSGFQVGVWASQEEWIDQRLEWTKTHPGVAFPS